MGYLHRVRSWMRITSRIRSARVESNSGCVPTRKCASLRFWRSAGKGRGMKLPDFLKDPDLNDLRARMGAVELGTFRLSVNPYRFTMAELELLIDAGIDVNGLGEGRPLPDHTLSYKDRRVLLYCRHVPGLGAGRALKTELPHFHLSNCPIVRRMRTAETISRHAVSAREDGQFQINLVRGPDV